MSDQSKDTEIINNLNGLQRNAQEYVKKLSLLVSLCHELLQMHKTDIDDIHHLLAWLQKKVNKINPIGGGGANG